MPEMTSWRPRSPRELHWLPYHCTAFAERYRGMPLGGLALPLAEAGRKGIPDETYAAALRQIMIPPAVDLGVDQSGALSGGETGDPHDLLRFFLRGELPDAPRPDHPALSGLTDMWQIAPVLAFIDLPSSDTLQTSALGFRKVLRRLTQGDISLDALPKWERWPHRVRRPLPWELPQGRGPVTQGDIMRFAEGFPLLAKWLTSSLGLYPGELRGTEATSANYLAASVLGFPVDMRVGSLVSPSAVSDAICLAMGRKATGLDQPWRSASPGSWNARCRGWAALN
jgi:hypothetical protein